MALDKFRSQTIMWDKANRKIYENIRANASDARGRKLVVQVTNEDVIEALPGVTLILRWKSKGKSGGKGYDNFNTLDANKGLFELYYTTGMLSNVGVLEAYLEMNDQTGRVISEPFDITVIKGVDDSAIEGQDSFTALENYILKINGFSDELAKKPNMSDIRRNTNDVPINVSEMDTETKQLFTGGAVAVVGENAVGTENVKNESITPSKISAPLGAFEDYIFLNYPNATFSKNGLDLIVKFNAGTIVTYRKFKISKEIKLRNLEYIIPNGFSLVFSEANLIDLSIKSSTTVNKGDKILLTNTSGRFSVNNLARIKGNYNEIVFTQAAVKTEKKGTDIDITFSGDTRFFLKGSERDIVLSLAGADERYYKVPNKNILVWSIYENKLVVKSWDSINLNDVIILSNIGGEITHDNIGIRKTDVKRGAQTKDDLIYYGSTVSFEKNLQAAGHINVIFSKTGDTRLFVKKSDYNTTVPVTIFKYDIGNHQSLVYNIDQNKLIVINSDLLKPGIDLVILSNHNGMVKNSQIRLENYIPEDEMIRVNSDERREIHWGTEAHQGMTVIGNYLLVFNESRDDHSDFGNLFILNKDTFAVIKTVKHNLGHVNSCDYNSKTDRMIIGNNTGGGQEKPPAIHIFENAKATFTESAKIEWDVVDKIVVNLFTSDKELGNYGISSRPNVCWGEEDNIVYIVMNDNTSFYRAILGRGANNLTSVGTFGVDTFGSFVVGKGEDEFNGTIRIVGLYLADKKWGVNQGIAYYKGNILTSTTHTKILTLAYALKENGKAKLTDSYNHDIFDEMGNLVTFEPEGICINNGKLYQSFRGISGSGIIVTPLS